MQVFPQGQKEQTATRTEDDGEKFALAFEVEQFVLKHHLHLQQSQRPPLNR